MPSPSEIDSSEIRATLIPWILLPDFIEDGVLRYYFYRFTFISNVKVVGRDPTGKFAGDVFGWED